MGSGLAAVRVKLFSPWAPLAMNTARGRRQLLPGMRVCPTGAGA